MTTDALHPAAAWSSIVAVWVIATIAAVCIAVLSQPAQYSAWLGLSLGGCTVATLAIQLATRQKSGFVSRLASSLVGVAVVLAIAALVLWIIAATQ